MTREVTARARIGLDVGPVPESADWIGRGVLDLGGTVQPLRGTMFLAELRLAGTAGPGPSSDRFPVPTRPTEVNSQGDFLGIGRAYTALAGRLRPGFYVLGEAGFIDEIFGGFGGEVLWRPFDARWHVGFEAHRIWVRASAGFAVKPHRSADTAFATIGWDLTESSAINAAAGRYPSGDSGLHLELRHRWPGGMRLAIGFEIDHDTRPSVRLVVPFGSSKGVDAETRMSFGSPPGEFRRLDRASRLPELIEHAVFPSVITSWARLLD